MEGIKRKGRQIHQAVQTKDEAIQFKGHEEEATWKLKKITKITD